VAKGAEAGHVPDLAIAGVVVVRVELTFVEEPAARAERLSFWHQQCTVMTVQTKVRDGSRQGPLYSPHAGQRSRPRGRPSGPAPARRPTSSAHRLAAAHGGVAEN
jgi:hypothetical protein